LKEHFLLFHPVFGEGRQVEHVNAAAGWVERPNLWKRNLLTLVIAGERHAEIDLAGTRCNIRLLYRQLEITRLEVERGRDNTTLS
jgi:hypothetical protein